MEYQDITNLSPFVYHEDFSCGPTNKKPKPVSLVGLFRPCPAVGPVAPTVPSRVPSWKAVRLSLHHYGVKSNGQ